jgi:hypothetical protein
MTVTFHPATSSLACDDCGCMVDASERGRAAHQRWHKSEIEVVGCVTDLRPDVIILDGAPVDAASK